MVKILLYIVFSRSYSLLPMSLCLKNMWSFFQNFLSLKCCWLDCTTSNTMILFPHSAHCFTSSVARRNKEYIHTHTHTRRVIAVNIPSLMSESDNSRQHSSWHGTNTLPQPAVWVWWGLFVTTSSCISLSYTVLHLYIKYPIANCHNVHLISRIT